mmetsp:Transcript_46683/g.118323  ORF Transcript_46683/g.118323 Transcript_46683/m.118323 type:complete len:313 (+) Transcript_46683:265-1203(+)
MANNTLLCKLPLTRPQGGTNQATSSKKNNIREQTQTSSRDVSPHLHAPSGASRFCSLDALPNADVRHDQLRADGAAARRRARVGTPDAGGPAVAAHGDVEHDLEADVEGRVGASLSREALLMVVAHCEPRRCALALVRLPRLHAVGRGWFRLGFDLHEVALGVPGHHRVDPSGELIGLPIQHECVFLPRSVPGLAVRRLDEVAVRLALGVHRRAGAIRRLASVAGHLGLRVAAVGGGAVARHDVEGAEALVVHGFEDVDLAAAGPSAIGALAVLVAWQEPDRGPHVVALGHLGREREQAVPVRLLAHDAAGV